MHTSKHFYRSTPWRPQKGAALIMSLVVLVLMTFIALSAVKSSVLEALMSANTQFEIQSLADAEVTIATGEGDIDDVVTDASALVLEVEDDHYFFTGGSYQYRDIDEGQYAIEYVGPRRIAGESREIGSATAGSFIYVFFVHGLNESGKSAWRDVQTVYITGEAP